MGRIEEAGVVGCGRRSTGAIAIAGMLLAGVLVGCSSDGSTAPLEGGETTSTDATPPEPTPTETAEAAEPEADDAWAPSPVSSMAGRTITLVDEQGEVTTVEAPAELDFGMSGFGGPPVQASADRSVVAYLGWEPIPGAPPVGRSLTNGTPFGTAILHVVDVSSGDHRTVRGVDSFALGPDGQLAVGVREDPVRVAGEEEGSVPVELIVTDAQGVEARVPAEPDASAGSWVGSTVLYHDGGGADPSTPHTTHGYDTATGESTVIGEGLSTLAVLDRESALMIPHAGTRTDLQLLDVRTGSLEPVRVEEPADQERSWRMTGGAQGSAAGFAQAGFAESPGEFGVATFTYRDGIAALSELAVLDDPAGAVVEEVEPPVGSVVSGWGRSRGGGVLRFRCDVETGACETDRRTDPPPTPISVAVG